MEGLIHGMVAAWDLFQQIGIVEGGNSVRQLLVSVFQLLNGFFPCPFTVITHRWPVLVAVQVHRFPVKALQNCILPGGDVQNDLPNTVRMSNGLGSGMIDMNIAHQFQQAWPMPRAARKSFFVQLLDAGDSSTSFCFIRHRALAADVRGFPAAGAHTRGAALLWRPPSA